MNEDRVYGLSDEGLTQQEIADEMGVSPGTVGKILRARAIKGAEASRAVYDEDGRVLWPSWEPTGRVIVGLSGKTYDVMRPLPPRAAGKGEA